MPFYNDLRPESDFEKRDFALVFPGQMNRVTKTRTINGLLGLKAALDAEIPPRRVDSNLLIASWNIKEFGHTKQRLPEAYFYIAEIMSRFDLIVVQEVKSTLVDLHIIMRLLGSDWDFLVNDITSGDDGNSERSAYIYNNKRVTLSGLAGELVLWPDLTDNSALKQFKRTPYLTGFKAGWKSFAMLCVHLEQGDASAKVQFRHEEVRLLLEALSEKMNEHWTSNLVVAGDFNFYERHDQPAITAFETAGFKQIDGLVGIDTNASGTESFDRMFVHDGYYFSLSRDENGKSIGGVFDPFQHVYVDGGERTYKKEILAAYGGKKSKEELGGDPVALAKQYQTYWKRNQLSDHFPIWFELITDSSADFLKSKKTALETR